jgi:Undecaprenyl-phosphate galactose phosphotransferase WbaP
MATAAAVRIATTAQRPRPPFTGAIMMAGDLMAISATIAASVIVRQLFSGRYDLGVYWHLWPLLGLFGIAYAFFGLYPGIAISPVTEIRTTTAATNLVFLVLGALTFLLRNPGVYSRLAFFAAWAASLVVVPLMRSAIRASFAGRPWWGYPAVIFGGSGPGEELVRNLVRNPEIGLQPVAIFDDTLPRGTTVHGVPVAGPIEDAPEFAEGAGITRAIIALPDAPLTALLGLLDLHAQTFARVYMVPGLHGLSSLGVETRDVSRVLALELRKNLLMAGPRFVKRVIDLTLAILIGICLAPVFAIIAALIKLESRGPVLYRQSRVGLGREKFRVWKFRSMSANADRLLADYLAKHPELREEWNREHKLKNDPRITRVGKFLRKTSLDELPQLLNVLRGEMSLVGPRPIVDEEIQKYGSSFALYMQVIPGLTGLWQVSGRSETTYEERVELDNYYVRNWSPWLDLYLLARTVKVVVTGYGAY